MKQMKLCLYLIAFFLLYGQGNGLAKTMYVTDRLYLSLRSAPDPEQPAMALLPSDTKVEVLGIENDWAEVSLEDGRKGWVMKRFLVKNLPKSLAIEELKAEIENKNTLLERLREENASLKRETPDPTMVEAKQSALKKKIETLKNQISEQTKRLEMTAKENAVERLKAVYVTGMVALLVGLIIGYLVRRPKKKRL